MTNFMQIYTTIELELHLAFPSSHTMNTRIPRSMTVHQKLINYGLSKHD